jgi:hypothetical protein
VSGVYKCKTTYSGRKKQYYLGGEGGMQFSFLFVKFSNKSISSIKDITTVGKFYCTIGLHGTVANLRNTQSLILTKFVYQIKSAGLCDEIVIKKIKFTYLSHLILNFLVTKCFYLIHH